MIKLLFFTLFFQLSFALYAVEDSTHSPLGIRPDCSEIITDTKELESIVKNSTDMIDFLKKIPEGSLQGFTFVTNSQSLHRGKIDENGEGMVSPMWPRVLRSSFDGKTTISFVCDPKNPTYGKVEIIHFDEAEGEFKTTEFDFGHPKTGLISPQDRIHHDLISCVSCHGGGEFNGKTSLKLNWPQYFQWSDCKANRGIQVYGGNDDNMGIGVFRKGNERNGCTADEYKSTITLEQENYKKFRELQKNNECFNTLPWPKDSVIKSLDPKSNEALWKYDFYPYSVAGLDTRKDPKDTSSSEGKFNLSLRTNLRFTANYSLLMSKRIAKILKRSPDYDAIKYLLVMEQAKCGVTQKEINQLNEIIPNINLSSNYSGDHSNLALVSPLLSQFSSYSGLTPKDWTMEFMEKVNSDYVAAIINGPFGDGSIHQVVGAEILKDINQTNPIIAKASKNKFSRGTTESYGKQFSCVDDFGGTISIPYGDEKGKKEICEPLKNAFAKTYKNIIERKGPCLSSLKNRAPKISAKLTESVEKIVQKINTEQIERGKKLVEVDSKGKCVMCHSASSDVLHPNFRFIPGEKDAKKADSVALLHQRRDELAIKIENRLIKTKTMPPIENKLTDQDREDIKAYLMAVAGKN